MVNLYKINLLLQPVFYFKPFKIDDVLDQLFMLLHREHS